MLNYVRAMGAYSMNAPLINKVLNPPRVDAGRWLADFTALFMPRLCSGCDNGLMPFERALCLECLSDLPLARFTAEAENPVAKRFSGRVELVAAAALVHFTSQGRVQRALHRLKYKGDHRVGHLLGRLMAEDMRESGRFAEVDAIIPVPLHPRKQRQRGYNQSAVLAAGMQEVWDMPILGHALKRAMVTTSQTRQGRWERWQNVRTAFRVEDPAQLRGRHVLLVDDVVTTGATVEACATALLAVPDVRLSFYAAAFA